MSEICQGWCVLHVKAGNTYPGITANIATLGGAKEQAKRWRAKGSIILAVCKESDLAKLVPLLALCRELDIEMDGVSCPASAAAILDTVRSVLEWE